MDHDVPPLTCFSYSSLKRSIQPLSGGAIVRGARCRRRHSSTRHEARCYRGRRGGKVAHGLYSWRAAVASRNTESDSDSRPHPSPVVQPCPRRQPPRPEHCLSTPVPRPDHHQPPARAGVPPPRPRPGSVPTGGRSASRSSDDAAPPQRTPASLVPRDPAQATAHPVTARAAAGRSVARRQWSSKIIPNFLAALDASRADQRSLSIFDKGKIAGIEGPS